MTSMRYSPVIAVMIIIIIMTTALCFFLYYDYLRLKSYVGYVAEQGRASLFFQEYINQNVAARLSREFSSSESELSKNDSLCEKLEFANGVYGFNLLKKEQAFIQGTLQSRGSHCYKWVSDMPVLNIINEDVLKSFRRYSFLNKSRDKTNNIRYYIDFHGDYIYINQLVNTKSYVFRNWLINDKKGISIINDAHSIKIDHRALHDLSQGENILTHIYEDGYTKRSIISIISPVFSHGNLKGVFISDMNIDSLVPYFYTSERPVLWRFVSLFLTDVFTKKNIYIHRAISTDFPILSWNGKLTYFYQLSIHVGSLYFLMSNLWALLVYFIFTLIICRFTFRQLSDKFSLSLENMTDAMTGLYNRKLFNSGFESKINALVASDVKITVIAIDCDGLKKINDNYGHHIGDKLIKLLGAALLHSIRKCDYAIRLGGDEFILFIIGDHHTDVSSLIDRIHLFLHTHDEERLVDFSYGYYQLKKGDTLDSALIEADKKLYVHKIEKKHHNSD